MQGRTDDNRIIFELNTDPEFMRLHIPMPDDKLKRMENNIVKNQQVRPIIIWNGYIVDGHKRYDICKRDSITFSVRTLNHAIHIEVM